MAWRNFTLPAPIGSVRLNSTFQGDINGRSARKCTVLTASTLLPPAGCSSLKFHKDRNGRAQGTFLTLSSQSQPRPLPHFNTGRDRSAQWVKEGDFRSFGAHGSPQLAAGEFRGMLGRNSDSSAWMEKGKPQGGCAEDVFAAHRVTPQQGRGNLSSTVLHNCGTGRVLAGSASDTLLSTFQTVLGALWSKCPDENEMFTISELHRGIWRDTLRHSGGSPFEGPFDSFANSQRSQRCLQRGLAAALCFAAALLLCGSPDQCKGMRAEAAVLGGADEQIMVYSRHTAEGDLCRTNALSAAEGAAEGVEGSAGRLRGIGGGSILEIGDAGGVETVEDTPFFKSQEQQPLGLDNGRIRACPSSFNPNCVSTSSLNQSYMEPWVVPQISPTTALRKIESAIMSTQKNPTIIRMDSSPEGEYLLAEVDGLFGRDAVEFLLRGENVFFRSLGQKVVYVYPFTTPITDLDAQRRRMSFLEEELGWAQLASACEYGVCSEYEDAESEDTVNREPRLFPF